MCTFRDRDSVICCAYPNFVVVVVVVVVVEFFSYTLLEHT